jgi:hypothetical protein
MKKHLCTILVSGMLIFSTITASSQTDTTEKAKSGWSFGGVPAIAYDSDIGFRYGLILNFFHYGDGTIYPKYKHNLYFEWSRTTKGSGVNQFTYDSKYLIPGVRITAEASQLTEQTLDFYGFNGVESVFNPAYSTVGDPQYISRMYYRLDRRLTRLKADFQGPIKGEKFRWFAGLTYYNTKINTVDIDRLNKGKEGEDLLPDSTNTLYDNYVEWGIIPEDQAKGGNTTFLEAGIIYDSRDNEPNPNKGIWTEALLYMAPGFLGNDYAFSTLVLTHRQYFTLIPNRMSFAYRLGLQSKLSGEMPFYMLPYYFNSLMTRDALGGAKTIRGVSRNRLAGESYYFGNLEARVKVLKTKFLKQNFYIALAPFLDLGQVIGPWEYTQDTTGLLPEQIITRQKDVLHMGYGAGVYFALNQNFIVAVNYGLAADKNDGDSGLYINLNFLF